MSSGVTTSTKIIPMISSGTAGPLGALHLPRLWAKLTLDAAGRLADGYDFCGSGFDQMTIDGLGLDREKTIAYVRENKPTYIQFERWVVAQNGGNLSKETIDAHNRAITGYNHADDLAARMRTSSGYDNPAAKDAVTLNMLEDLDELRAQVGAGG
ncbi:MAG: DUF5069 domain-containing protein [Candidatus Eremiobacteraeota bacterium]|nr:DUF5069 domain-containing protein [Candidatus Eremiobacteraeota bacterium]